MFDTEVYTSVSSGTITSRVLNAALWRIHLSTRSSAPCRKTEEFHSVRKHLLVWQQLIGPGAHTVNRCSLSMMGTKLAQLLICFWITLPCCVTEKVKERTGRQRDAEFTDKVSFTCVKLLQVKKQIQIKDTEASFQLRLILAICKTCLGLSD